MSENKKDFRSSMTRLEEIVSLLERNQISLEEAMQLFEEGLQLVKECDVQLTQFESKVESLVNNYAKEGEVNE